jgi:hypothetical protein
MGGGNMYGKQEKGRDGVEGEFASITVTINMYIVNVSCVWIGHIWLGIGML